MRGKENSRSSNDGKRRITPAYAGKSVFFAQKLVFISGSPPRMRGKVATTAGFSVGGGITPAYAGKSDTQTEGNSHEGDHPRVCGEKFPSHTFSGSMLGSPPRMRGKVYVVVTALVGVWDHPRVCGEKQHSKALKHIREGSPPRMRGKDLIPTHQGGNVGITPAYAGKSSLRHVHHRAVLDHPRVCGEKISANHLAQTDLGSPPRMRGKAAAGIRGRGRLRITPAYAGKRIGQPIASLLHRDHPRVCGEKPKNAMRQPTIQGSPPRMRGKGRFCAVYGLHCGITPAYAGKRRVTRFLITM